MRQGIILPESAFSADFLTVSVPPPCAISKASTSVKDPKHWLPYTALFGHSKTLYTALRYFDSATLAADVPFPVKDNEVPKKKKRIKEHLRLEIERLGVETDFAGDVDPSCVVNGHALILPSTIIISSKDG